MKSFKLKERYVFSFDICLLLISKTYFGVAAVVSSICECLVFDQKHIRPLSVYSDEFNVCLSFPSILGSGGVNRILDLNLNETERQQLLSSAKRMREIIDEYEPKLG